MVKYSKLGLKTTIPEAKTITVNDVEVSVKQYLPMNEKDELCTWILDNSIDNVNGTFSPFRVDICTYIGLIKWYGDISFTEKQLDDMPKIYDTFITSDVARRIIEQIPEQEFDDVIDLVERTISAANDYNTSAAGIIQRMLAQSNDLGDEATAIIEKIRSKEGIELLNDLKILESSRSN